MDLFCVVWNFGFCKFYFVSQAYQILVTMDMVFWGCDPRPHREEWGAFPSLWIFSFYGFSTCEQNSATWLEGECMAKNMRCPISIGQEQFLYKV